MKHLPLRMVISTARVSGLMAPQLCPGIPPHPLHTGKPALWEVVLPLANPDYLDFFQSHSRKIASMYFKDYFCQGHSRGKKKKKKREKGTILNNSSHLSPLALGEVGASRSPWELLPWLLHSNRLLVTRAAPGRHWGSWLGFLEPDHSQGLWHGTCVRASTVLAGGVE